ncbi:C1 family peptidase [uncultured Polaribacter sp.]|uniref:C1 family peptidase n=1 Tax=uncultured Polaribacter sp. TaxID=174711 RepID=UPI0030D8E14E|tara:strand:+ start:23239 stop:24684 length:1446 start_codon:yes stop_codon:yes gene_type:complete
MKKVTLLFLSLILTTSLLSQEFGTGLKFDQNLYESMQQTVPLVTRSFDRLPISYSLKGYTPTPQSQGAQGSCVGWASAFGARTIAYAVKNNWENNTAKINENTFSPAFVYNQIKVNDKCEGAYIENAMMVMNTYGSVKMTDFPYNASNCTTAPSSYTFSKAQDHKILTYERLAKWENPVNLTNKVKKALSNKNPVVIGLFKFTDLKTDFNNVWISNTGTYGHAMVVVGYDDTKAGGAFEIMNSWGSNFGKGGFFWIKYDDFERQVKTAYVLIDKEQTDNNNNNNNNNNNIIASNILGGELTLKLGDGTNMPTSLSEGATRNFNIVKATKTTYKVDKSYSSGTQFRIYLNSKQKGYVYLIGYGSSDKSVHKLYPFDNFSDYFSYTNSEIALPNEDYFIEFDNNPGRDILCVLYSKEKLDIDAIVAKSKNGNGDFVSNIKEVLSTKMYSGSDVTFSKNKIEFSASSTNNASKVVPIFIEMNHQ